MRSVATRGRNGYPGAARPSAPAPPPGFLGLFRSRPLPFSPRHGNGNGDAASGRGPSLPRDGSGFTNKSARLVKSADVYGDVHAHDRDSAVLPVVQSSASSRIATAHVHVPGRRGLNRLCCAAVSVRSGLVRCKVQTETCSSALFGIVRTLRTSWKSSYLV